MLVQIVHDPDMPARNGVVEDVDDGVARLMIRDGIAKIPEPYQHTYPTAPAVTPGPGPVTRTAERRTSERKAADVG